MIAETIRQALQALFPEPAVVAEKTPPATEAGEGEETAPAEDTPRPNNVIERDYHIHGYHVDAQVAVDQLLEAVTILDAHDFFIEAITGVDWIKTGEMEVIYDFSRYDFDLCRVVIRTRVPRDEPLVPTITGIYAGANWHERETHEFFGIVFNGHPHLIPLLLPEDADFHPLRKDYKP
ncbi:MAG: NADH-quinone oxidoreductase subunit C [Desulfopila sp.]